MDDTSSYTSHAIIKRCAAQIEDTNAILAEEHQRHQTARPLSQWLTPIPGYQECLELVKGTTIPECPWCGLLCDRVTLAMGCWVDLLGQGA